LAAEGAGVFFASEVTGASGVASSAGAGAGGIASDGALMMPRKALNLQLRRFTRREIEEQKLKLYFSAARYAFMTSYLPPE